MLLPRPPWAAIEGAVYSALVLAQTISFIAAMGAGEVSGI